MKRWVYFLRPIGADGPVKIGSSTAPRDRLNTYLPWSPLPLELVAWIEGDDTLERRFHAQFRHLHSHHEWFHADPALTVAIDQIRVGCFDITQLPAARKLPCPSVGKWSEKKLQRRRLRRRMIRAADELNVLPPSEVCEAYRLLRREGDDGREAAVAVIEAYLAAPLVTGWRPSRRCLPWPAVDACLAEPVPQQAAA